MKSIILTTAFTVVCVFTNAQTNVLNSTGNAGIGTTAPSHLLQISGGMTTYTSPSTFYSDWEGVNHGTVAGTAQGYTSKFSMTNFTTGSTATDGTIVRQSAGNFFIQNQEANGLITLQANRAILMLNSYNDRINVGDVNFNAYNDAKFNIASKYDNGFKVVNYHAGYFGASVKVAANTDNALLLYGNNANPSFTIRGDGFTELYFRSAGNVAANLFTIRNNDRKLLQVSNDGILRSREIIVDGLAWADYVFQPEYKLMPLSELRSYISTNGHLPNVPTTAEVETQGINVAKTDAFLLEKIEELTLYLLEQEVRMKALEEEIQALKKETAGN